MFLAYLHTGQDSVEVGVLPTLAHSVSGVLYVDDAVTFRVENFTYDGQGPGIINIYAPTYLKMPCFSAHRMTDPYTIYIFWCCADAFIYYYPPGISPEITGGGIDIPFNST